jgi:hypothetical protein
MRRGKVVVMVGSAEIFTEPGPRMVHARTHTCEVQGCAVPSHGTIAKQPRAGVGRDTLPIQLDSFAFRSDRGRRTLRRTQRGHRCPLPVTAQTFRPIEIIPDG